MDAINDTVSSNELDNLCADDGKILKRSAGSWACADDALGTEDNLGDHTATTNIQLGSHWLSGDGGDVGIRIDALGSVGINSLPGDANLKVGGQNGVVFGGTFGSGVIPQEGYGYRMMWYPKKAAFRTGFVNGTQWDEVNTGVHSFAAGYNTTASGHSSMAVGFQTTASRDASTALGYGVTASGTFSTAIGQGVIAESYSEIALGMNNTLASDPNPYSPIETDRILVVGNGYNLHTRSNALVILKNGNIGVGLDNPNRKLYLMEDVDGVAYPLKLDNLQYTVNEDAVGILFSVSGAGSGQIAPERGKGALVYMYDLDWNRGDFHFLQNPSQDDSNPDLDHAVLTIKNNGRVGIKTKDPGTILDVNGRLTVRSWAAPATTPVCRNGNVLATCDLGLSGPEQIDQLQRGLETVRQLQQQVAALQQQLRQYQNLADEMEGLRALITDRR